MELLKWSRTVGTSQQWQHLQFNSVYVNPKGPEDELWLLEGVYQGSKRDSQQVDKRPDGAQVPGRTLKQKPRARLSVDGESELMWPTERFLAALRCTGHHRQGQTSHSRVSFLSFCCPSLLHGSGHSKVRPVVTQCLWELTSGLFKITRILGCSSPLCDLELYLHMA